MQGIINLNKPQGMTSHDCVGMIRRLTGIKKVGHAGTLDPMAIGVLPVCVGRATRIMQYLDDEKKEYICRMTLGTVTDTQDIWGERTGGSEPDASQIARAPEVLKSFEGEIMQTPPVYSALKVNGKKLYEYARKGIEVEIKPRKARIYEVEILNVIDCYVDFRILCGRGTYIRSICDEAGKILGCGACMSSLERTMSAGMRIEESVSADELRGMTTEEIEDIMYPPYYPLDMRRIAVSIEEANALIDGKHIALTESRTADGGAATMDDAATDGSADDQARVLMFEDDRFIGIGRAEGGSLIPEKIFDTEKK